MERTCGNGTLRASDAGKKVTLIGWVSKRRNLGSLVFIDLRDRTGTVQVTFDETMAEKVKDVRNEYILSVTGTVTLRKDANPKMETGEIEIHCEDVTIVNSAETLPIDLSDNSTSSEDTRLKYRYLDLRRPSLQKNMILRHKICMIARNVLDEKGFIEVETPILAKSTPEGAFYIWQRSSFSTAKKSITTAASITACWARMSPSIPTAPPKRSCPGWKGPR